MSSTNVGRISLGLYADDKRFNRQINGIARNAENTMGKSFGRIGTLVAGAFAITKLVSFGKECIRLGSDLQEIQNVVDVAFPSMSNRVDEFAQSAITNFGLSESAAKRMIGTFGAMSKAFGFTEAQAYEMSAALTGLAGDVASFYNISEDLAYTKLKSVFSGETETLKDLGIVMTQTALDQYALANGYGKTTNAMTEQEKVSLRLAFVTQQLSSASGDFVRTADGWANQTRVLSLRFEQLKATIGQGFINLFTPILKVINSVLAGLQTLANYFLAFTKLVSGNKVNSNASALNKTLADSATNAKGIGTGIGNASKEAKKLKGSLAGFDDLNVISSADSVASGGGGIGSLGGMSAMPEIDMTGIETATEETDKFTAKWLGLKDVFEANKVPIISTLTAIGAGFATLGVIAILPSIAKFFSLIKGGFGVFKLWTSEMGLVKGTLDLLSTTLGSAVLPIAAIVAAVMAVVGALTQLWLTNEGFRATVMEAWNGIKDTLKKIWDTILKPIFDSITKMLSDIWEFGIKPLWDGWVEFVRSVTVAMLEIWNIVLKPVFDWLIVTFGPKLAKAFNDLTETISFAMAVAGQVIGAFFKVVSIIIDGTITVLKGAISFITGVFTGDWDKAWEGVLMMFSGHWDSIVGVVKTAWDLIVGLFSSGGKIFSGVTDGIAEAFKAIVNSMIVGLNKVIKFPFDKVNGFLNNIRAIEIPLIGKPFAKLWGANPIGIPQIPMLAQGAYVKANQPQLAMIGDNRHQGEFVAPEGKLYDTVAAAMKNVNPSSSTDDIMAIVTILYEILEAIRNVSLNIDGRELSRTQSRGDTYKAIRTGRLITE